MTLSTLRVPVIVLICLATVRCGSDSPTGPSGGSNSTGGGSTTQPSYTVANFVSNVTSTTGATGSIQNGSAPQPAGGPAAQPTSNTNVINGGSTQVRLQSPSAFQTVYVFVGNVAGGVGGFWQLRLPSATSDATIVVTLAQSLPASSFDLVYGVANAAGAAGTYSSVPSRVVQAQSGSVQVSVSWTGASDVDLHVVDPRGEEIYWGHETSASGGALDLDSNAGCLLDNINNENIRWPVGRAPAGSYTVRVDYWSNCSVSSTNYVVTVRNGGTTQTFNGNFTGNGDQGGAGSGRSITSFTYSGGSLTADPLSLMSSVGDFLRMPITEGVQEKRRLAGLPPRRLGSR